MNRLITYIKQFFRAIEKVSDRSLVCQHPAYHSEDVESGPFEYAIVLYNGYQTVCYNRNINLYSHSVLRIAPKGSHTKMLLYPSEEKFNLPSLFVQQGNIASLEGKVICEERERSLQFRSIVNYSPESTRILFLGLIARKTYRLVKQNVIRIVKQVFTVNNLVVEMRLLSDDKERVDNADSIQPCKVIVPFVKDVECIRFVRNVIHSIHIMNFSFRDMNISRNLSHNVKQRMNFDPTLCLSKECPLEQTQTEINGRGVKRIELSMQDELPVKPLALCKVDHIVGELFEYPVIPVGVCIRDIAKLYVSSAKSEMVTLILDGINDADDLSKAVAAGKLSEHHHKKLVPACERLHILVSTILLDDSIKYSLWQKLNELTEKVLSAIHACLDYIQTAKMENQFKSTRAVFANN